LQEFNRPPIELNPFTVTPTGWTLLALYLVWFSWSIFRPASAEEAIVYERQANAAAEQEAAAGLFLREAAGEVTKTILLLHSVLWTHGSSISVSQEGATRTASGLVYKELLPGSGEAPGMEDTVVVHYTGKFVDGSVFDSS